MTSSSATEAGFPGGRSGAAVFVLTALAVVTVTFSVAASSIAMGAAFAVMGAVVARRGISVVPRTGLEAAFLLYIAAELISSAFSVNPPDSLYNTKRVLLIGIVYLGASAFREKRRILAVFAFLAVSGAVAATVEALSLRTVNGMIERPMMFQLPLTEGGIRMMILLLVIPLALARDVPVRWRIPAALLTVPLFAGLVITQARSAWLAFLAGAFVIGLRSGKHVLIGLVLLVALFLLFAPADFRERAYSILDLHEGSNASRFQMLTTGWRMFLDRPVTGWGDTGLRSYYVTYITPLTPGEGGHLHNNFMEVLVTLGAPGFCAVVYLFIMMFVVIRRSGLGSPHGSFRAALGTGLLAAYAGFHVLGLFEYNFGDHEVMVLLWFMTGLAAAAPGLPAADGGRGPA